MGQFASSSTLKRAVSAPIRFAFADRGQFPTEGLQTEFQAGTAGFAVQQPGQGQGHHAVESMNADLLIGPVIQGLPAYEVGVRHGAEGGLHMMLTAVSQNDLLGGPLVVISEQNPPRVVAVSLSRACASVW